MKRSMIALAVMSAVTANTAVMAAAPTFSNDQLPTAPVVVDHTKTPLSGSYMVYTVDQEMEVKDLDLDVTVTGKPGNQIFTSEVLAGATFTGSKLNVSITTDATGTGNSMIAALDVDSTNPVTISADTVNLKAVSTSTDGKAAFGIATWSASTINFTSKSVNVSYETATDRKDDKTQYNESSAISATQGSTINFGETTVLTITGKGTGTTQTTPTSEGKHAYPGNYTGAAAMYGIKMEGGTVTATGTTNITLTGIGNRVSGIHATNFYENSSHGDVWGSAAGQFNNVIVNATSEKGDALGLEAYLVEGQDVNKVLVNVNGTSDLSASSKSGNAYGVSLKGKTTVQFDGDLHAKATSESGDAYVLYVEEGRLTVAGASNQLDGDLKAVNAGTIHIGAPAASTLLRAAPAAQTQTSVDGSISADATSKIIFNNASVEVSKGNSVSIEGELTSTNGQLVLNDVEEGTVQIATLTEGSTLDAVASGSLNDKLGGDLDAFSNAITITNGAEGTTLVMKEGLVAGEKTAQLTEDGTIDETTVTEKTNSVMQSSLEMASALPLTMNRILTNDVRKRMGDLRASEGTSGAWVRYDGGKLSGDNGLDSKFNTIQVGVDTIPTADAPRVGLAFSYTDGDMDYVRSSSDMQSYSLAGYATWMADNGMFLDTVVRMAKFKNDMTVDGRLNGTMDSLAVSVSGETGWRFDLNDLFYVEPQFEAMYTYIDGDNFDLGNARYAVDSMDSFTGRLGFASGLKCPNNKGDVYVRASVVHEFLGDSKITGTASGSTGVVEVDGKDTWVEYGIGGNFNLTKNAYFWADVERTSGGLIDADWRASAGVRLAF